MLMARRSGFSPNIFRVMTFLARISQYFDRIISLFSLVYVNGVSVCGRSTLRFSFQTQYLWSISDFQKKISWRRLGCLCDGCDGEERVRQSSSRVHKD
jgi:hypothetical protein